MGNSPEKVPQDRVLENLVSIFKTLGYPESLFIFNFKLSFSLSGINHELILPLIIQEKDQTYFWVDYKPQTFLSCFERGFLSLARLLTNPLPYFGIITNLTEFILIDFYVYKTYKGKTEIIPHYTEIKTYSPSPAKPFNPEIETKILNLYLKGG
ncbi:hypothetical protein F1847_02215 [Thermodesulfobacterium sp. TA1]|uniref:hypothetical protein n=1 Tax=Thermodesulfobacterium sp. TA1 TaxID=2234087 RepID=UPI001231D635|nr:hypothetical protein [Thermodesulfobacterium sp. TA1]QER41614.1 hypothetical protein F1847_02215 [Thermodesulfobacterium sp. TA1]